MELSTVGAPSPAGPSAENRYAWSLPRLTLINDPAERRIRMSPDSTIRIWSEPMRSPPGWTSIPPLPAGV